MFSSLKRLVSETRLVKPIDLQYELNCLQYNNFNTTVRLVPEGYVLPLECILAYNSAGFIKCTPRRFAAITIRLRTVLGNCTHLIFRSGKMNIVGAKTVDYARYSAQYIRCYISRIKGPFLLDNGIVLSNIVGRTVFQNFRIQLIVVSASLNCRPKLDHILEMAPDLAKWTPDLFPGLQFRVWIKPRQECTCIRKKGKFGCKCNVRVILFDTGKIVITGNRSIEAVNTTLSLLNELFLQQEYVSTDPLLPSHLRYNARKELLLNSIEFTGFTRERKYIEAPVDKDDDSNSFVLDYVPDLERPLHFKKRKLETLEDILQLARKKGLQENIVHICAIMKI